MTPKQEVFRAPRIAIQLDEISAQNGTPVVPSKVQLLKTGNFNDPRYGDFKITKDVLQSLKTNFDNKIRGIDVSIDYAHNSQLEAAGWIQSLELTEDPENKNVWQLWATVKWTPNGQTKLSQAEYRYLSADFVNDYQDNETKKNFGPCLLGAGLTNRPVIKGMAPAIELTEGKGDNSMDMAAAEKKIKELSDELQAVQGKHKSLEEEHQKMSSEYGELKKKLAGNVGKDGGDGGEENKEDDPAEKAKEKELSELKAKVAALEDGKKLAEQKSVFHKLLAEGKAIPAQEESFLKGDMVKFAELQSQVNLKARGHGGQSNITLSDVNADASTEVLKLADVKLKDKSAKDLGSAISMVLSENKPLADKYYKESAV